MDKGITRANANRKIRQDALREQLSQQKHLEHVCDILGKLSDPDTAIKAPMVQRYKVVLDTKLKLMNKYLPDLRHTEIAGDEENPVLITRVERVIVKPSDG